MRKRFRKSTYFLGVVLLLIGCVGISACENMRLKQEDFVLSDVTIEINGNCAEITCTLTNLTNRGAIIYRGDNLIEIVAYKLGSDEMMLFPDIANRDWIKPRAVIRCTENVELEPGEYQIYAFADFTCNGLEKGDSLKYETPKHNIAIGN